MNLEHGYGYGAEKPKIIIRVHMRFEPAIIRSWHVLTVNCSALDVQATEVTNRPCVTYNGD